MTPEKKKFEFLITGVAGYIGSNLAEYLLKKKFKVVGIDNFSNSNRKNINYLKKKYNNFQFYYNSFEKIPENIIVKNIIHLAAKSVVEKNNSNLKDYKENNIIKFEIFLKRLIKYNCRKFIFISSAAIYEESDTKISENFITKPKSYYGKSKLLGEKLIKKYLKKNKTQFTILRLFNIIGGKMINTNNSSVLSLWRNNIQQKKKIY